MPFNVNGTIAYRQTELLHDDGRDVSPIQFITGFEANDAQPWYLYMTPQAPHSPTQPEAKYANAPANRHGPHSGHDRNGPH